jgi:hypothetical protein
MVLGRFENNQHNCPGVRTVLYSYDAKISFIFKNLFNFYPKNIGQTYNTFQVEENFLKTISYRTIKNDVEYSRKCE